MGSVLISTLSPVRRVHLSTNSGTGARGGAPVRSGRSSDVEETQMMPGADEIGPWSTVEQLVRTLRVPAADAD